MAYLMSYHDYLRYNRSGIYSISVIYTKPNGDTSQEVLYIGKSKNMYRRVQQHVREITRDWPKERKYQLFHNIWLAAKTDPTKMVKFDIVEYCDEEQLDEAEEVYIDYFKPPLNTVGMNDDKTIDQRLEETEAIKWILDLSNGWINFED